MSKIKFADNERLNEALLYLRGLGKANKNTEISKKIKLSASSVSEYISGKTKLSENFIRKFAKAYDLNEDYLLYGIGSLLKGNENLIQSETTPQITDDEIREQIKTVRTHLAILEKLIINRVG